MDSPRHLNLQTFCSTFPLYVKSHLFQCIQAQHITIFIFAVLTVSFLLSQNPAEHQVVVASLLVMLHDQQIIWHNLACGKSWHSAFVLHLQHHLF